MACSSTAAEPTHWMTTSGPWPPVRAFTASDRIAIVGGDGFVGAELTGQPQLRRRPCHGDDPRPHRLPDLHGIGTQAAHAEHDQRLAGLQLRHALEAMERRGDRVGQDGQHDRRHRGARDDEGFQRTEHVLGERTIDVDPHARHVWADVRSPTGSPRIVGRRRDVVQRDLVPDRDALDPVAERIDDPRRLVPGDDRQRDLVAEAALLQEDVRAAHAARLDSDPDVTRPRLGDGALGGSERGADGRQLDDPHRRAAQYMRKPPETLSVAPVMYFAWSDARNTTGPASSSGSAT